MSRSYISKICFEDKKKDRDQKKVKTRRSEIAFFFNRINNVSSLCAGSRKDKIRGAYNLLTE